MSQEAIKEGNLTVDSRNRITVPAPVRNGLGLVARELVQIEIENRGTGASFSNTISSAGRVRVPQRIREEYNISPGDSLTVSISKPAIR